ncbi:hypothetical protein ACFLYR_09505 [Chloroflexota bacterium]
MPRWYIIILVLLACLLWPWLVKRWVRPHRAAILATAIPPTLLAIAFVVLYLLTLGGADKEALSNIWVVCIFVTLGLAAAAILSSVVFVIMRKWEIAKGTSLGGGIGFVV